MDYITKATSRNELRTIAKTLRDEWQLPSTGPLPVLEILERVPIILKNCSVEIVEDAELPPSVPAQCEMDAKGHFTIKIKETIYDGACRNVGGYRMHIMHEICHLVLYKLGFTPIFERRHKDSIPVYCTVEWQVKALCGELMMPYEESKCMNAEEIATYYGVSRKAANYRLRY